MDSKDKKDLIEKLLESLKDCDQDDLLIKPDWLAAAEKAYHLAINDYWETTDSDKQWLVKIGKLIQQRKSK